MRKIVVCDDTGQIKQFELMGKGEKKQLQSFGVQSEQNKAVKILQYKNYITIGTEGNRINTYDHQTTEIMYTSAYDYKHQMVAMHYIGENEIQSRNCICTTQNAHCLVVPLELKKIEKEIHESKEEDAKEGDKEEDKKEEKKEEIEEKAKISIDIPIGGSHCNGSTQCWSDPNKIAFFSDSYLISIWNINEKKCMWKAKNLPNDELNLTIPINDLDAKFSKTSPYLLYTATANGEVFT